ncbi:hypothetical protein QCA50_020646 [Cerrena zonata]|uniref:F-box domain-containing protein n=1 Tax=Cerrena zonata TaxID=2478898 RepID=A0AAW0FFR0_9APHY
MSDMINSFKYAVANLKSRRNAEATINNLPEKVLVCIFDIVGNSGYNYRGITRLSWTCAMWRDICLRNPTLWRCIDLSLNAISPRILDLFVERNRTIPRSVKIADPDSLAFPSSSRDESRRKNYEAFIVREIDSIRDLALGWGIPNKWFVTTTVKLEPKLLEMLSIRCVHCTPTQESEYPEDRRINNFFDQCPNLRYLSLDGILLPSSSTIYNDLKTLKITSPTILPGTFDIISIIRRAPLLETLFLSISDGTSLFKIEEKVKLEEPVPVVNLKHLTLELPSADILYILSSLTVGSSTHISLKNTSTRSFTDILPLDPRCLPCLSGAEKVAIDRQSQKIEIYQSRIPTGVCTTSELEGEPLLSYSLGPSMRLTVASLVHLVLNLRNIKELTFIDITTLSTKLSAGDLVILLSLLPDIRCVRLHSCGPDVCQLIAAHAQHGRPRLCHVLEALYLESMVLKEKDVVLMCTSLAPHIQSVTVLKCSFGKQKRHAMSILKTIQGIDLQIVDSTFNPLRTKAQKRD